jgi:hypothetical protein
MSSNAPKSGFSHEKIETNNFLMIVLILLVVAIGGLVEIVPLFFQKSTTEAVAGMQPPTSLQVLGRDVYVREGCYNCHSQMIRPFRAETLRYGHYSVAGEFVYDHPFQWGSKRTGPDLHRVGGKYSDEWHRIHLVNPQCGRGRDAHAGAASRRRAFHRWAARCCGGRGEGKDRDGRARGLSAIARPRSQVRSTPWTSPFCGSWPRWLPSPPSSASSYGPTRAAMRQGSTAQPGCRSSRTERTP